MKKLLLIATLALSATFSSCSKKNDTDPETSSTHYNDNLSIVTTLAGGNNNSSGWRVTNTITTYFTSANQQLQVKYGANPGQFVWEFMRRSDTNYFQTGTYTDYMKDGKFYNPNNFVISNESGKNYLVVYSSTDSKEVVLKYEIEDLNSKQMILTSNDVQPLTVTIGNTTATAHHATVALTLQKL